MSWRTQKGHCRGIMFVTFGATRCRHAARAELLSACSIMDSGTDGGDRRHQPIAAPDFALHVQPSGSSEDDGFVVRLRVQPLRRTDIAARVQAVKPIVAPGSEQERGHAARSRAIAERSHGAIRRGPLGLRSQPPKKAATVCTRFPATAGSAKRPMQLVDRHSPTYPITPDLRSHPAKNGRERTGMSAP